MSFGYAASDFVLVLQLAKKAYKNCVEAGAESMEIAREIRSLYSVLKHLHYDAEKNHSSVLQQEPSSTTELVTAIDGSKHILEDMWILLAPYEGFSGDGEAVSGAAKLWHRFRFVTKIEALGAVRAKMIVYTSTTSVHI